MTWWYLEDLARFRSERGKLAELQQRAGWCTLLGMKTDSEMRIVFDVDIHVGNTVYEASLRFPAHFPFTPPLVFPRNEKERWSGHQYGAGGELCLEYGPDTWTPDLTAVDALESAFRLLSVENPAAGAAGEVPSRHKNTLGQSIRGSTFRLVLTRSLQTMLDAIPIDTIASGTITLHWRKPNLICSIYKMTLADQTAWSDENYPAELAYEGLDIPVSIIRVPADCVLPDDPEAFLAEVTRRGHKLDVRYLVLLAGKDVLAYRFGENNKRLDVTVIAPEAAQRRMSIDHDVLVDRNVGLIGCGSLGSKIGTMLARAGVGRFVLVDDDVLLVGNLVRNDLDWRDVGSHKAEAVARRMQLVNPKVQTRVRRMQLGGQESAGSADSLLDMLSECDLIIDATANSEAFNLISVIAGRSRRAVLWAEVFAGGIGGLIARSRPGKDPAPQNARAALENWFAEQGATPVPTKGRDYATGDAVTQWFANDADVSAIAAPAARLAIDTLIERTPSLFPCSAYAIGLGVGSVFTQPFQTFPIDLGPPLPEQPKEEISPDQQREEFQELAKAFVNK